MRRFVKDILAQIDYSLYQSGFKECPVRVHTIEETIEELIRTNKSMIRFGDGEITMIRGRSLKLQQVEPEIIDFPAKKQVVFPELPALLPING